MMGQIEQQISEFQKAVSHYNSACRHAKYCEEAAREDSAFFSQEKHRSMYITEADLAQIMQNHEDVERDWGESLKDVTVSRNSVYKWITYFEKTSIPSIGMEIKLARLIDEIPSDARSANFQGIGSDFARRAMQHKCQSPQDSQELIAYFKEKSLWDEAIIAARQGYEQFRAITFRKEWLGLLEKAGRLDEAITIARQGYEQFHNDALRKEWFGLLEKAGRLNDLIALLQKDFEKSPGNLELVWRIAQLLEKAGRLDDLLAFLQENLEKSPGNLKLAQKIAQLLLKAKGLNEAVAFLNAEIEKVPQNQELREYLRTFLIDALKNAQAPIRRSAIALLQERKDERAVEPLTRLFEQENLVDIRLLAIQTLVNIQGNGAIPSLWKGLADSSTIVRSYAAQTLGEIGNAGVVENLVQVLNAEKDGTVREAIVSALGKLDNRPRKWWEKMLNRRPWAGKEH
jgi:tetratricopeptide (TPR) repeat protein